MEVRKNMYKTYDKRISNKIFSISAGSTFFFFYLSNTIIRRFPIEKMFHLKVKNLLKTKLRTLKLLSSPPNLASISTGKKIFQRFEKKFYREIETRERERHDGYRQRPFCVFHEPKIGPKIIQRTE